MRTLTRWSIVGTLFAITCSIGFSMPVEAASASRSVQVRVILPERPVPQLPGAFNAAVTAGYLTVPPVGTERTTTLLRNNGSTTILHTEVPIL
jgi:hypothetical protein